METRKLSRITLPVFLIACATGGGNEETSKDAAKRAQSPACNGYLVSAKLNSESSVASNSNTASSASQMMTKGTVELIPSGSWNSNAKPTYVLQLKMETQAQSNTQSDQLNKIQSKVDAASLGSFTTDKGSPAPLVGEAKVSYVDSSSQEGKALAVAIESSGQANGSNFKAVYRLLLKDAGVTASTYLDCFNDVQVYNARNILDVTSEFLSKDTRELLGVKRSDCGLPIWTLSPLKVPEKRYSVTQPVPGGDTTKVTFNPYFDLWGKSGVNQGASITATLPIEATVKSRGEIATGTETGNHKIDPSKNPTAKDLETSPSDDTQLHQDIDFCTPVLPEYRDVSPEHLAGQGLMYLLATHALIQ